MADVFAWLKMPKMGKSIELGGSHPPSLSAAVYPVPSASPPTLERRDISVAFFISFILFLSFPGFLCSGSC